MTDVDSIRWMASEHDLEFVDLDNYGVDPAAGEILPVELARRHHMVAIKRKFGTPVIATADPDDLYAQDSVRAVDRTGLHLGGGSPEQIGSYLDRLFGPDPFDPNSGTWRWHPSDRGRNPRGRPDLNYRSTRTLGEGPGDRRGVGRLRSDADQDLGDRGPGPEGAVADRRRVRRARRRGPDAGLEAVETRRSRRWSTQRPSIWRAGEPVGPSNRRRSKRTDRCRRSERPFDRNRPIGIVRRRRSATAPSRSLADDAPPRRREPPGSGGPTDGKGRREGGRSGGRPPPSRRSPKAETNRRWDRRSTGREPAVGRPVAPRWTIEAPARPVTGTDRVRTGFGTLTTGFELPRRRLGSGGESGRAFDRAVDGPRLRDARAGDQHPARFGSDGHRGAGAGPMAAPADPLTASVDQLAELARSLQTGEPRRGVTRRRSPPTWSTRPWPPTRSSWARSSASRWSSRSTLRPAPPCSPPWPRPWSTASGCPSRTWRRVLEEHYQTGQSIARILTAQKLVTEADLMWGMAQEMGLEFVDLDTRGHRSGRGRDHPRGHRPAPQRAGHRQRQRHPGGGRLEPHRRVRHGRPAHHHGPQLHRGGGHPVPDQRLHRSGVQQRRRRRRHGHGGVARDRGRAPTAAASTTSRPSPKRPRSSATSTCSSCRP